MADNIIHVRVYAHETCPTIEAPYGSDAVGDAAFEPFAEIVLPERLLGELISALQYVENVHPDFEGPDVHDSTEGVGWPGQLLVYRWRV